MTTDLAAALALGLYVVGLAVTFGVRSWLHRRRTGSIGFNGFSGGPATAGWWGGVLFLLALVLAAVGLVLAQTDTVVPPDLPRAVAVAGLAVAVVGVAGVVLAQGRMGAEWRIGVDPTERTQLVTTGAFGFARNPVFTAMCAVLLGLMLMVPTGLTLVALVSLVAGVQLQVRAVEEPYLLATHGKEYADYAARVGRFLPGVGRLDTTKL